MIGYAELEALAGTLDEWADRLPADNVSCLDQERQWWRSREYDPDGVVEYALALSTYMMETRPEMFENGPGGLASAVMLGIRLGIISEGG